MTHNSKKMKKVKELVVYGGYAALHPRPVDCSEHIEALERQRYAAAVEEMKKYSTTILSTTIRDGRSHLALSR
jgi:hypothetical protein